SFNLSSSIYLHLSFFFTDTATSEIYTLSLHDALPIYLARRIVESLSLPLSVREHRLMQHDVPASGEAYRQYLRANRLSEDGDTWDAARDVYLESIRRDPNYAPAWAGLGRMYRLMAQYGAGDARE